MRKYCYLISLLWCCILCSCAPINNTWDNLTGPLQSPRQQPAVPTVKLNFALPQYSGNDRNDEGLKLKSVGFDTCDFIHGCTNTN